MSCLIYFSGKQKSKQKQQKNPQTKSTKHRSPKKCKANQPTTNSETSQIQSLWTLLASLGLCIFSGVILLSFNSFSGIIPVIIIQLSEDISIKQFLQQMLYKLKLCIHFHTMGQEKKRYRKSTCYTRCFFESIYVF